MADKTNQSGFVEDEESVELAKSRPKRMTAAARRRRAAEAKAAAIRKREAGWSVRVQDISRTNERTHLYYRGCFGKPPHNPGLKSLPMRRSDAKLAEVPRGVDATALVNAASLWRRAGPELSERVAAALVQAEEGDAVGAAGALEQQDQEASALFVSQLPGDETAASKDGAQRQPAAADGDDGLLTDPLPAQATDATASSSAEWDASGGDGSAWSPDAGRAPAESHREHSPMQPAPAPSFASMSAVIEAVEKAASRSGVGTSSGAVHGESLVRQTAPSRRVHARNNETGLHSRAEAEMEGGNGQTEGEGAVAGSTEERRAKKPSAAQRTAARQLRKQLLELQRLRKLESQWDTRASVTRAKDNSKLPLSRREYFDAPKPFDESTRGIEPRAIDGFVRTEDGQFHYAFYSLRNAERAATSPRPRAPVRPGTVEAPSPMGFSSSREAGFRAIGMSSRGGEASPRRRGAASPRSAMSRNSRGASQARVSGAGTDQSGASMSELPPPPVAMMPSPRNGSDAGEESKQTDSGKQKQSSPAGAARGMRGRAKPKIASPSAGGPGSSGWLTRMKKVYKTSGEAGAARSRPVSASAPRRSRPQSARAPSSTHRGAVSVRAAASGGAPPRTPQRPHTSASRQRPQSARISDATSRSRASQRKRKIPGAARQFLPPPSRRHQPKRGTVLGSKMFRSPRAPAPVIRVVPAAGAGGAGAGRGNGKRPASAQIREFAGGSGLTAPSSSPMTVPASARGRSHNRDSPLQLGSSVQGMAMHASGQQAAIIAIPSPSRGASRPTGAFAPSAPSGGGRRRLGSSPRVARASPGHASDLGAPRPPGNQSGRSPHRETPPSFVLGHLREVSRGSDRPDPGSEVTALLSPHSRSSSPAASRKATRVRKQREAGWDSRHAVVAGTPGDAQLRVGARA